MRESEIEKKVTVHAVSRGWVSYKWASPGRRGVPDRLYFKAGKIKIIEFKAPGKLPTVFQQMVHRKLGKEKFKVDIVDNIAQGIILFN